MDQLLFGCIIMTFEKTQELDKGDHFFIMIILGYEHKKRKAKIYLNRAYEWDKRQAIDEISVYLY